MLMLSTYLRSSVRLSLARRSRTRRSRGLRAVVCAPCGSNPHEADKFPEGPWCLRDDLTVSNYVFQPKFGKISFPFDP
jgi:hypothetical protein